MATGNAVPDGVMTTYRPDGSVLAEATYVGGVLDGPYRDFWSHGGVSMEGRYRDGLQEGEWRFYDRDTGELREVWLFIAGRQVVD
jgi:antitoxin component YwqK of YwqJK toxin-antitoxin module